LFPFWFKDIVMKRVRMILLSSIFLLACSLVSPLALPSPTAIPPAALTIPPQPAETPTETPANLPAVTLSAGDFTPILFRRYLSRYYEFQVIGGVQAGNWLPAGAVADTVRFEQAFDLYAPAGFAGTAVTKDYGIPLFISRCGETFIGSDFSTDIPNLIGVAQGWDVTHRPWLETAVDTPVYYAAVADWLVSQGFTLPYVQISRILRVDLEGDGVDEVFISAAYFNDESGHMAEQGDYSIILMRKLVGSEVVTVPVVAELYTSPTAELAFPFTYSLASLLDLNRDGNLELIVEVTRWEGSGVILYQVDGTNVIEALRAVCTQ
jgi:hypothetical protein